jgi:hypothetical protein
MKSSRVSNAWMCGWFFAASRIPPSLDTTTSVPYCLTRSSAVCQMKASGISGRCLGLRNGGFPAKYAVVTRCPWSGWTGSSIAPTWRIQSSNSLARTSFAAASIVLVRISVTNAPRLASLVVRTNCFRTRLEFIETLLSVILLLTDDFSFHPGWNVDLQDASDPKPGDGMKRSLLPVAVSPIDTRINQHTHKGKMPLLPAATRG